ncbi:MAG TPA: hypothetical protein VLX60_11035 [Terriglobales bacterium]|nr:hypothetical protein [Terriglobales bacterium]
MIRRLPAFVLPAVFLLLGCFARPSYAQDSGNGNAQTTPPSSANSATPPANPEKPKKVWTNDDVKSAGSISVVGDSRNQKYSMTKPADPGTIAKYKNDLQKLTAQLDDVTKKLHEYQDFASGKPATEGGNDVSHGYTRTPVDQQIAKLQNKKKQLEDQIDSLYESARKQGIESGQLK